MKTLPIFAAALILSGAAAAAADAQPGRGGHGGPGGPGGHAQRAAMMLRAADINGDNSITRAEVEAMQQEMFAWMDRDGDGYLTDADANPVRQRLRAAAEEDGQARRGFRRGQHGGEEAGRRADTDQDGRISYAEFMAQESPLFDHLDENADGVISPEELDAAADRRQNRGRWWRQGE